MPSFQSIVPSIVEHERIGTGLALNSTQFNLSRVLGPSLAGLLMVSFGAMSCFVVSAVSYLPFIGVALWILPRRSPTPAAAAIGDRHLFSGAGPVLRQRHLLGPLLTVLTTSVLCAPLVTFTPVLVKEVFHQDAGHFSTAVASFGIGGILGAFVLLADPPKRGARRLSTLFAVAYGLVLVLAGLNRWFGALPPLLVLAGAAMTISSTSANSFLQANADPRVLGRTVSLYMLAMRGGLSLGALVTGIAVDLMGVRHALIMNGGVAIAAQAAIGHLWSEPGRQPASPGAGTAP
jgi:predicted MFS family arabinose efflux permease